MPILSRMKSLLRNMFHKQRSDQELDEELHTFVEMLAEEKTKAGATPEEARRTARIELGGIEQVKERVREVRIGAWLAIGSPDGQMETIAIFNEKTAPYFWAMEVSGHFQAVLLKAIDCGVSADLE